MRDSRLTVVSSAHGQLRQLLVAFASDRIQDVLEGLWKCLPPYTQLVIWAPTVKRQELLIQFLASLNISFEIYSPENATVTSRCLILSPALSSFFSSNSSWIQDPFLVLTDRKNNFCLFIQPPACAGTGRNQDLPNMLIDAGFNASTKNIPWFHFQGGNCLTGDDFMLIGSYDFRQTMAMLKFSDPIAGEMNVTDLEQYTHQRIGSIVGMKRIIPVGNPHFLSPSPCLPQAGKIYIELNRNISSNEYSLIQPFPHLDLYISLAGRNPQTNRYQLLIAEIVSITNTTDDKARVKHLNHHLSNIAIKLEQESSFQVFRNPVPLLPGNHFAYYNNCLLEITDEGSKTVWLPQFANDAEYPGLERWDHKNANIWQSIGFHVVPLNILYPFTLRRGAIHCLAKYLHRT